MKQSLTKVVDAILKHLDETTDSPQTENGMRSWLARQGYSKRDIEAALRLVRPQLCPRGEQETRRCRSVRIFSADEERVLTGEARQALERLDMYGLVSPYEREMILERLNTFDGPVGLEELDYLLSWLVCSTRDVETQHVIYSMLDGEPRPHH